jgi:hypothetical protein
LAQAYASLCAVVAHWSGGVDLIGAGAAGQAAAQVAAMLRAAVFLQLCAVARPAAVQHLAPGSYEDVEVHWYSCTDRCLDVHHGETWNGNKVAIWECVPGELDQRFTATVENHMKSDSLLRWSRHPDKCIQVDNSSQSVELWDCNEDNPRQHFSIHDDGNGQIRWAKSQPPKCLEVDGGKTFNGNVIDLEDCDTETVNQRFFIVDEKAGVAPAYSGCRTSVLDEIAADGVPKMTEKECHAACTPTTPCGCALFHVEDQRCLILEECPALPEPFPPSFLVGSSDHYKVLQPKKPMKTDNGVMIRWYDMSERCIDISGGHDVGGDRVQIWQCSDVEPDQRFALPQDGTGQIVWTRDPTKCIQVDKTEMFAELWDCEEDNDRQVFEIGSGKLWDIRWHRDKSRCLEVDQGHVANGTRIRLGHCDEKAINQLFFSTEPSVAPEFSGSRAKVLDQLEAAGVGAGLTEEECDQECRAAGPSCECALFREGDGRCLMLPHCPTRPEPLPARFPVGEDHYRVLKRRAF